MPITAPVSLTKIRNEFTILSPISTSTYNSGSATVTAPSGSVAVKIEAWGGGGAGGGSSSGTFNSGGGGGAGGYSSKIVYVTAGVTQFTYSIGAGGLPDFFGFGAGGFGNNTTVVSASPSVSMTAGGGLGGGAAGGFGGNGGTSSGGDTNTTGGAGGNGGDLAYQGGNGGNAPPDFIGGLGGSGGSNGGGGTNGSAPGGGGGGGGSDEVPFVGSAGGAGAAGRVSFTWYQYASSPNFSSYVRGGIYVPDIPQNSGISNTVAGLAMSQFLNASRIVATLPSWNSGGGYDNNIATSSIDFTCSGAYAELYLYVNSDGTIVYNDMIANYSHTWLIYGNPADFYFRFDVSAGTNPDLSSPPGYGSAAINTNLQMNQNYWFRLVASVPSCVQSDVKTCEGTWSIRDSSNNVLASKTFYMAVEASSYNP